MDIDALTDLIYEAGGAPELWPAMLDALAAHVGARGGNLIHKAATGETWVPSHNIADLVQEFCDGGWNEQNTRVSRYLQFPPYAGFVNDLVLHTEEEVRTLPIYRDFLNPRGVGAGAATIVQGADNDGLLVAVEAFADHDASHAALPLLDRLRPHLARAVTLSGQFQLGRIKAAITALEAMGAAAAMLGDDGRVQAVNMPFTAMLGSGIEDRNERLRLIDRFADQRLATALAKLKATGHGSSIGFMQPATGEPAALHLIPIRGRARDIFVRSSAIALIADTRNTHVPNADLLQSLFDLTPAEARVARALVDGRPPNEIARASKVSIGTVRVQLKGIYQKTDTGRQTELVSLLMNLGRLTPVLALSLC